MKCPRCGSYKYVKDGIVKGKQRFLCKNKECSYRYTTNQKCGIASLDMKRIALILYLVGYSFEDIAKHIGFTRIAVFKWIEKMGIKKLVEDIRGNHPEITYKQYVEYNKKGFTRRLILMWNKENGTVELANLSKDSITLIHDAVLLHLKRISLILYLEGCALENIPEYIGYSSIAILKWIKQIDTLHLVKIISEAHSKIYYKQNVVRKTSFLWDKLTSRLIMEWNDKNESIMLIKKNKPWELKKRGLQPRHYK